MNRYPLPSPPLLVGMNYYHESMGYISRTNDEIKKDLDRIAVFSKRIRVYHNPYTNAGMIPADVSLNICKNVVSIAKSLGFYVIWIENRDSGVFTESNWEDYRNKVILDAKEAMLVGADEFFVGNEISLHNDGSPGYDDTNLPIKIKNLAQDCSENFPYKKGYQDGWWKKWSWTNAGLGNLDTISFTIYENQKDFEEHVVDIFKRFKNKASIGEYSTQSIFSSEGSDEEEWARKIGQRTKILKNSGLLEVYYFCWREGVGGFGIMEDGDDQNMHLAWQSLLGGRQYFVM